MDLKRGVDLRDFRREKCLNYNTSLDVCNKAEQASIQAFRDAKFDLLSKKGVRNKDDRAIWAPSCLFHCFYDKGYDSTAQ